MELYRVYIRTYHFGIKYYELFVLATDKTTMLAVVYEHPLYKKDKNANIIGCEKIDLNDKENRVL